MKKAFLSALVLSAFSAFAFSAHAAQPAQTLPSGVVVQIEQQGTGAQPTAADTVRVNYVGTLADGTVFDASAKHGGPATFPLGQVVPCFQQGIGQMKIGGKAKLTCPPQTAYGNQAIGAIPPNSTLTFEVELLGIVK